MSEWMKQVISNIFTCTNFALTLALEAFSCSYLWKNSIEQQVPVLDSCLNRWLLAGSMRGFFVSPLLYRRRFLLEYGPLLSRPKVLLYFIFLLPVPSSRSRPCLPLFSFLSCNYSNCTDAMDKVVWRRERERERERGSEREVARNIHWLFVRSAHAHLANI